MLDFQILRRRVYSAARLEKKGIPNPRYDTSDIAQESILQLLKERKRRGDLTVNQSYLSQVGSGNAKRMLRTQLAQKRSLGAEQNGVQLNEFPQADSDPALNVIQQERFLNVIKAISMLSADQQLVVYRRFFDQLPFTEIASELEVTYDTVRGLYQQATKRLRQILA